MIDMSISVLFQNGLVGAALDGRSVVPGAMGSSLVTHGPTVHLDGFGMSRFGMWQDGSVLVPIRFSARSHIVPDRAEDLDGLVAPSTPEMPETVGPRPPIWHRRWWACHPDVGIRQDVYVVPADDPTNMRLGWTIIEEVGVAVINDYATDRISIEGHFVNRIWQFYTDTFGGRDRIDIPIQRNQRIGRFRLIAPRIGAFRLVTEERMVDRS